MRPRGDLREWPLSNGPARLENGEDWPKGEGPISGAKVNLETFPRMFVSVLLHCGVSLELSCVGSPAGAGVAWVGWPVGD